MARATLSEEAELDLAEIREYSIGQFSRVMAKEYLSNMRQTMKRLADHPAIGEDKSDELWPGVRCFPYMSHDIYFIEVKEGISVIGIIHQSRLPTVLLKRQPDA
ncbi:type II toxin-antitoxin system RelE/ParE family toxin [Erwinia sp. MMLR14_017]|uniref:type II toxin-antitoxin system RelE/ParE family toxin n=1 Tax=Erwinia sp. MMLR14_017 TaxID=3093842 RepID=UPI00298FCE72|nr:type II toxin-antitoxin system RelE/ParE family toxin [Erwinia sp. MMLR14_017]MDW8844972.1 type II toxin-antitoxin system RelE/ParE family toxin [Erwinia sp. MMLR14_017]